MLGFSLVMNHQEIRAFRHRNGWTQVELALRLGTDPVTVSRWERGISSPRPSAQIRLKELSNVLPLDLALMVRSVGHPEAKKILERQLLLAHRLSPQGFAVNPTRRLEEVDRARSEQTEMKTRMRLKQ